MHYFCYDCMDETDVSHSMCGLVCLICQSGFIEEVDPSETHHYEPYTYYDVGGDLYEAGTSSSESAQGFGHDLYDDDNGDDGDGDGDVYYDQEEEEEDEDEDEDEDEEGVAEWDWYEDASEARDEEEEEQSQDGELPLFYESDHTWETYEEGAYPQGTADYCTENEEDEDQAIEYEYEDAEESYNPEAWEEYQSDDDSRVESGLFYGFAEEDLDEHQQGQEHSMCFPGVYEITWIRSLEEYDDRASDDDDPHDETYQTPGDEDDEDPAVYSSEEASSFHTSEYDESDNDEHTTDQEEEEEAALVFCSNIYEEETAVYYADEEEEEEEEAVYNAEEIDANAYIDDDSRYYEEEEEEVYQQGRGSEEEFREAYDMSNILRVLQEDDPEWGDPGTWQPENLNGATPDEIRYLPRRRLKQADQATAAMECTICQEPFGCELELLRLPCHHEYHGLCIERWLALNATCPICRYPAIPTF